ncbi:MAG: AAA family ATPase [Burkholderiaceae bacterium]|nr:AAA family ATPase [Burkholderiaceae bacterium]
MTIYTKLITPSGWLENIGINISNTFSHFTNLEHPRTLRLSVGGHSPGERVDYGITLGEHVARSIYAFRAERLNLGETGINGKTALDTNAGNLPDVLNQLSSRNPERYHRLLAHVRTIFPHITHITAPIVAGTLVKILVWTVPTKTEREDLAVPLADSGTGIGQVLAMLYVVVTSDTPKIIIIDEPQSFLHPGAVRQLFEILRGYSQHQYVISTHSPFALSMSSTDKILLIRREGSESKICQIDPNSQEDLRLFLDDVGARLGDVFGAESILWVEGKTEERCFPELVRHLGGIPLQGVQILGVISTDELGAKLADRVYDIYVRVSGRPSLLPPAVAFVFDKEGRSESDRNGIERKSRGLVKWLPLRMYENYLLEAAAIVEILNSVDGNRQAPIIESEIDSWFVAHGGDKKYFRPNEPMAFENENWRDKVHGACVLRDLFCEMTENRIEYDKVTHGLALTQYLIDHPTPMLRQLAEFLSGLVKTGLSR